MGRHRIRDIGLPERVLCRRGKYYYVTRDGAQQRWLALGPDKDAAITQAARFNGASQEARIAAANAARRVIKELRDHVFARDQYKCFYCGATSELEVDHIVPFSAGGRSSERNLVVACATCNASKSDEDLAVFFARLHDVAERALKAAIAFEVEKLRKVDAEHS